MRQILYVYIFPSTQGTEPSIGARPPLATFAQTSRRWLTPALPQHPRSNSAGPVDLLTEQHLAVHRIVRQNGFGAWVTSRLSEKVTSKV